MKKIIRYVCYGILLVVIIYACGYMVIPKFLTIGKRSNHNVYVSLGFHVNMYHSYRIDTNDEAGFGKDIRVIRKIIEVLDEKVKMVSEPLSF